MAALSQLLAQDQTTPFFVSCLLNHINTFNGKEEDDKLINASSALYVLVQRIYDPSPATQGIRSPISFSSFSAVFFINKNY
jgi:hypothetical protein